MACCRAYSGRGGAGASCRSKRHPVRCRRGLPGSQRPQVHAGLLGASRNAVGQLDAIGQLTAIYSSARANSDT